MSLCCGEGKEPIRGLFVFVYCVGSLEKGLRFEETRGEESYVPPNCVACHKHFSRIPKKELKKIPKGIEGLVYAAAEGAGIPQASGPFKGNVQWSNCISNNDYVFAEEATLQRHIPGVLEIITQERLFNEFPHEHLGLKASRVIFDKRTGRPLYMLSGVSLKDRSQYVVTPILEDGKFEWLKETTTSIDYIAEQIRKGTYGVHNKQTSSELLRESSRIIDRCLGIVYPDDN